MSGVMKSIKKNFHGSQNIKKIQNYTYNTDLVVGNGNFSTVYEATSLAKLQRITVKIISMKSLSIKRLEELLDQQINILLTLNHANIIKCFDVLKTAQECYIFTEMCEGGTLDHLIKQKGGLSEEEIWSYIKDIFQGLKYLKSKNIIHRDIKPANLFIKGGTIKIADFGFAINYRQHFRDMNIGSPLYMSPEGYIDNIYGPKTDVWAFGIVLYQLLHGRTPNSHLVDTESLKSNIRIPIRRQDFRSDISYDLRDLICRCLQINESSRISIQQIENHCFMRRRLQRQKNQISLQSSVSYQNLNYNEGQLNRYRSSNIIRIPSKILIGHSEREDNRLSVKIQKPANEYHPVSNYKNVIRIRSALRICDVKSAADSSTSGESNPESPLFAQIKIQNEKLKSEVDVSSSSMRRQCEDVREVVRVTSYENYLKRESERSECSLRYIK